MGGFFLGLGVSTFFIILIVWYVLLVIGYWKMFEKAGKPGWHSIIPILNTYDQYDMCWNGILGIVYGIGMGVSTFISSNYAGDQTMTMVASAISIVCLVISVVGDWKLAKCFGKGVGTFIGLLLLQPIFMMILGFGDAQYIGKDE